MIMNSPTSDYRLLERYASPMGGVFSTSDLRSLFDEGRNVYLKRRIDRLAQEGLLTRFCRGFFTTPAFDHAVLAMRLNPQSYVSLGSALARELMIGSVPARALYCVKTGSARAYSSPALTVTFLAIAPHLYFGFRTINAVQFALPEKALLDTLYFHLRGHTFSFDIFSDIDISRLDTAALADFLSHYRNPRFVQFVKGYLNDRR